MMTTAIRVRDRTPHFTPRANQAGVEGRGGKALAARGLCAEDRSRRRGPGLRGFRQM